METKRTWPWKKKSQEKIAAAPESAESSPRPSPHSSKAFDEQDVTKILSDQARVSDEAVAQWQQSEVKLQTLNERLSVALADITAKDNLVKQHAKVAEEAVSGWEKAESEAATLKQQLDIVLQQKLATEDRVSHLDGALKECMKQLRHVREEQEQRIHETLVKKTREYDKLRTEMEAKLAEVGQQLQDAREEALESRGESRAISNALQDRTKTLNEIADAKARAETDIKILQVRLETVEKENSSFKYELHVLNKELEIRNQEREYERKAADIASKQQLESVKKIAKLEAECQRLRILVRKKLPGPAALAQMKIEADSLGGKEYEGKRRRSLGRSMTSSDASLSMEFFQENMPENNGNREAEVLAERLMALDEELKMLKEALVRSNGELQASRLMCAKTASKLSFAEEQLEAALRAQGKGGTRSLFIQREGVRAAAVHKDGDEEVAADAWASALVTELAHFKRNKVNDKVQESVNLDLMDDFIEMERLASTLGANKTASEAENHTDGGASEKSMQLSETAGVSVQEGKAGMEELLSLRERELELANKMCQEISEKLAHSEEQLAALQTRNCANEAALIGLQDKLDRMSEFDDGAMNISKALEDLVEAHSASIRSGIANEAALSDRGDEGSPARDQGSKSMSSGSSSDVRYEAHEDLASVLSDAESKASTRGSDLGTIVRRVFRTVETLAHAAGAEHGLAAAMQDSPTGSQRHLVSSMHWKNPDLDGSMQSLAAMCNKLIKGQVDTADFLSELSTALNLLVHLCSRTFDSLLERIACGNLNGVNTREKDDELRRVRSEKAALESHMRAEMSRLSGLEVELETVKKEKEEVKKNLETAKERLESLQAQLGDAQKAAIHGRDSRGQMEKDFGVLTSTKEVLEREMQMLQEKADTLVVQLQEERRQHEEVMGKYIELQQQVHGGSESSGGSREGEWSRNGPVVEEDVRMRKEREIASAAEKLAECQRSILDLGKQLKALTSSRGPVEVSYDSDTASSADRLSQSMETQAEEIHSGGQLIHHERTPSARSRDDSTPWSTPRGGSVPGSPFVERRRSPSPGPSPPQITRGGSQNGNRFLGLSYGARQVLDIKQGNGFHVANGQGDYSYGAPMPASSPSLSEFSLLGSLSMPASPARSPATVLPFKPRGSSPMRTSDYSKIANGGATDSDSSASTFSRFYSRTKSSNRLE